MAFIKSVAGKKGTTYYLVYNQKVRGVNGELKSKKKWLNVGKVKSEALQALRAFKKEFENNRSKFTATETELLYAFVTESYLPWCQSRKTASEYQRTSHAMGLMMAFFGTIQLNELTPKRIEDYVAWRKSRLTRGKAISNRTVNIDLIYLSQCYSKAVEWGLVELNPCKKVKRLRETKSRVRFFSESEIQQLLSVANPYVKRLLIVGLSTGLRLSELLNLKLSQIDFENHTIHVTNDDDFQTKSRKNRDVPISAYLMGYLKDFVNSWVQPVTCEIRKRTDAQSVYLFCHENGERLKSFKTAFSALLRRAGIQDATIHTMRHTFASQLVMKGVGIRTVQELLGHSSISVTEMYSHLSTGFKKKEIDLLDYNQNNPPGF